MKKFNTDYLLLFGNLTFGGFAVIFWTLFLFCHTSMAIPIILTFIQFLFLVSQFIWSKTDVS